MRLAVPALLEKIKTYRPGLVCFVGKGIWDKFADIVGKASEEPELAWEPFELRLPEEDAIVEDVKPKTIKVEPQLLSVDLADPSADDVNIKPDVDSTIGDKKRKPKPAFDWTQPRSFKLVHPTRRGSQGSVTLFWIVPSTSGLERTPVSTSIRQSEVEVLKWYSPRSGKISGATLAWPRQCLNVSNRAKSIRVCSARSRWTGCMRKWRRSSGKRKTRPGRVCNSALCET